MMSYLNFYTNFPTRYSRLKKLFCLSSGILVHLFLSSLLYGQTYHESVKKILEYDTDIRHSSVKSIHYALFADKQVHQGILHLKNFPTISADSAIVMGNALSIYPIYLYLSLRKCLDTASISSEYLKSTWDVLPFSLRDFIFHNTRLPKHPEFPISTRKKDIFNYSLEELISLASRQEKGKFCSVSILNTLIAVHLLSITGSKCRDSPSIEYLDSRTFAKAQKGLLSFNQLCYMSKNILLHIDSLKGKVCPVRPAHYVMKNGFYYTELNSYPFYIMTGRIVIGRVFIGVVPSTMTGVILLSEGKSTEIIDLGFLIMRMLNHNWKK